MASCCKLSRHWGTVWSPELVENPVITGIAKHINKTRARSCSPGLSSERSRALLTASTIPSQIEESFRISSLPEEAVREIHQKG